MKTVATSPPGEKPDLKHTNLSMIHATRCTTAMKRGVIFEASGNID